MSCLILRSGKIAQLESGERAIINGLEIKSNSDSPDRFYDIDTKFFKIACPPGTRHEYKRVENGKINLL